MEEENIVVEDATVDTDENVEEVVDNEVEEIDTEELELDGSIEENTPEEQPKKTLKELLAEDPSYQTEFNEIFNKRFGKKMNKVEETYKPLIETLKGAGFDGSNPNEITNKLRDTYAEQGIEIPKYQAGLSEREEKALAKVDADEVIELGETFMQERFNELYTKQNRTPREEQEMFLIGKEHSTRLAKRELMGLGADPDKILNDSEFKTFASKMASNVPVADIYKMYQKLKGNTPQPVASAGSVKNNTADSNKFTQAKIDNMTPQELMKVWDDPEFRKIAKL